MGDREVSFYVCGHQDDWQLFMGSRARDDVQRPSPKARVVFVFLTSGRPAGDPDLHWQAREAGAVASAMWLRGLVPNPQDPPTITFDTATQAVRADDVVAETMTINGEVNTIQRYAVKDDDTVCYFFRMPEKAVTGTWGSDSGGWRLGPSGLLRTDCSWPEYSDVDALRSGLTQVFEKETKAESRGFSWVNSLDNSPAVADNGPKSYQRSHVDHRAASVWAKLAADAHGSMRHETFIGYRTRELAANAFNGPGPALFETYANVTNSIHRIYSDALLRQVRATDPNEHVSSYAKWPRRQYTTAQARAAGLQLGD